MGIDIERGYDRGRCVGGDAGEWRGWRGSDGDVEIHVEQGNGRHSLGGTFGNGSAGGGATDVHLSITKCHFERDIGNRGNEVGGIFILASPDRAASNHTVTGLFENHLLERKTTVPLENLKFYTRIYELFVEIILPFRTTPVRLGSSDRTPRHSPWAPPALTHPFTRLRRRRLRHRDRILEFPSHSSQSCRPRRLGIRRSNSQTAAAAASEGVQQQLEQVLDKKWLVQWIAILQFVN